MPPMRPSTVRFSESMWRLVAQEAGAEGITVAQFVREAAILRAMQLQVERGELDPTVEALRAAVERLRDP